MNIHILFLFYLGMNWAIKERTREKNNIYMNKREEQYI